MKDMGEDVLLRERDWKKDAIIVWTKFNKVVPIHIKQSHQLV
jgi:hypothetical protein